LPYSDPRPVNAPDAVRIKKAYLTDTATRYRVTVSGPQGRRGGTLGVDLRFSAVLART